MESIFRSLLCKDDDVSSILQSKWLLRTLPCYEYDDTRIDHTNSLPDECLALIFKFLKTTGDRNNSSLVSRRWLRIDAQTRTHLCLDAKSDLQPFIPSIFNRFNSLTKLVLLNRTHVSINDDDMILITSMCPNLTRLKLLSCEQLTDSGMAVFSRNCKKLKEFTCDWSSFSDLGMFELLDNCSQLEVFDLWKLFNSTDDDDGASAQFRTGAAAKMLKVIKLMDVYNQRLIIPLISRSKNLKTLKLNFCGGDWVLELIPDDNCLAEVYLEQVRVTDVGVSSLAKCCDLTTLLIENSECTDAGLISVAENCKALKKLFVDDWLANGIGDEGLIAVGKHSVNLQELVLKSVSVSCVSLQVIATNCQKLVRLELCRCETITDMEMMCIAEKFVGLKFLCIEEVGVSDNGIKAFAFPNMVSIRVLKCKKLTPGIKKWLKARTKSIAHRTKALNASTSDSGVQEHVVEVPPANHEAFTEPEHVSTTSSSIGNGGPTSMFNDSS